jgi:quinol-cytochrome oxidoreductase complex cytochrome b subunit
MTPSPLTTRISSWLRLRLPLDQIDRLLTHKTVPQHDQAVWYYLGSILLMSLGVLLVTGMLLAVYYQPSVPDDPSLHGAHESVARIVMDLPHGWWIRSLHHWAAHLMIMGLIIHLMSTLLLKAYRKPRELIWWSGLALFGLSLASVFTGYLLPWNDLSFAATRVGAGILGSTPLAGPLLRELMLGGPDVTGVTLTRFFALHVAILPPAMLALVAVHVLLVIYHGSSSPPPAAKAAEATPEPLTLQPPQSGSTRASARLKDQGEPDRVPFWPHFVYRDARVSLLLFGGLAIVAFLAPPALGTRADPLAPTPAGTRPEWYFMAFFKTLTLLPTQVAGIKSITLGVIGAMLVAALVTLLPVLDLPADTARAQRRRARRRAWPLLIGAAALLWIALLVPGRMLAIRVGLAPLAGWVPIGLIVLLATATMLLQRSSRRDARTPATAFGVVLLLVSSGYTFWEAFGTAVAGCGVAGLALVLVLIGLLHRRGGTTSPAAGWAAVCLLIAALLLTLPLGKAHEQAPEHESDVGPTPLLTTAAIAEEAAVSPERRAETASRFAAMIGLTAFLLWAVHRQIGHHRRLRAMGMTD